MKVFCTFHIAVDILIDFLLYLTSLKFRNKQLFKKQTTTTIVVVVVIIIILGRQKMKKPQKTAMSGNAHILQKVLI
jgi:hypothetical protein